MKETNYQSSEKEATRKSLADILLRHSEIDGRERPGLSQGEMASAINRSRRDVFDSLRSMHAEGLITIERHRIILNKQALADLTSGV